ncbi:DUF3299 domain-containing protein [Acuticoccus sp. I52.16.1]|uniref:DUF3299 domain-containing protein n=1 Tax=Acuticoccus sp. I52.16.1 TaxID=2928472 RepID=UPI001FD29029|nr:DUF3299 domain-containing protein [Acuticoccus sp. I52.16.1]UOM35985.1 DUF3299 domain-containing protein [Acuticoccus sp. I52.16.1]
MVAIAVRGLVVALIAVVVVGATIYVHDQNEAPPPLVDADGNVIEDTTGFTEVPGFFDGSAPHELVRYDLPEATVTPPLAEGVEAITFPDLWAPGDFKLDVPPEARLGTPTKDTFEDGMTDEDIANFFLDMSDMREMQPRVGRVRDELDGKRVRLAGYASPVGFELDERQFLLVPELGACVHVPPPPPNQVIYVDYQQLAPEVGDPVWVTGTLRATPVATILADVGYRLEDVTVEPYR